MEQINAQDYAVRANVLTQPIEQLSSFCRGEMSAVETYERAMAEVREGWILTQLRANLDSHARRVQMLRERILDLGGTPPETSGPWGAFANAVEGVATAIGERAALSILEEGERHGLADYRADLQNLDYDSQRLVETHLIPQQAKTQMTLHRIVESLSS
jgi:hypothetical protein